ncbi:MAG: lysylphosphatidylglycerol synthase transmembrane domain-containing protein [Candidatus Baldrarchaeia archaeon]
MSEEEKIEVSIPYRRVMILLIIGVLLILVIYNLFKSLKESFQIILGVNIPIYILAIIISVSAFHMYIFSWVFLLRALNIKIRLIDVLSLVWTSYFFDAMVPTASVSGEAIRAYLTTKKHSVKWGDAISSVVAHRIITILSFAAMTTISFTPLYLLYQLSRGVLVLAAITISLSLIILIFLLYLSLKPRAINTLMKAIFKISGKISKRIARKLEDSEEKIVKTVCEFSNGMKLLINHKKVMFLTLTTSALCWLGNALAGYVIFLSLGYNISFILILFIFTLTILIRMVPIFIPGSMGLFELATIALWSAVGVSASIAAAVALLNRNVWAVQVTIGLTAAIRELRGLSKLNIKSHV